VALACAARVATPRAKLGLPELQLGILPGFGGTQRLPRLVGLQTGLKMILTSAPLVAEKAVKAGLIDEVAAPDALLPRASALALAIARGEAPRLATLTRTDRLEPLGEALQMLEFAAAETARRAPNLTHPLLTIEAIKAGVTGGGRAGLAAEAAAFAAAAALPTHRALVHFFFAQRATRRVAGVTDAGLTPRPVRTVAVLGGGLMGSGIATACVLVGMAVILKDINAGAVDAGLARIKANLASRVRKGKMSEADAAAAMARVTGTTTYDDFKKADMVVEAAIERVDLKQQIFADLEAACRPDAVLTTNTSTIDIGVVGAKMRDPARVVGNHFFSPAHIMPLLEIVRTDATPAQAVLDTLAFGGAIKKTPVVVKSCTGFAVNRVFFPYTQAAMLALDLGNDPFAIDAAIARGFGMPMGPFRLNDLVGSDIGLHVGKNFVDAFSDRVYPAQLIVLLNEAGRLGEKSGAGFYKHEGRKAKPDPAGVGPLIERARAAAGLKPMLLKNAREVAEFILFPVVNEACRVVAEGVVDKPGDLDVASVMAMGFPPYRGGIICWGDEVGAATIARKLDALAAAFAGSAVEGFFRPCAYLRAAAEGGTKLGAGNRPGSRM
jgi:enoyl-CoA hydratase/3-hydroxyacyl-CoA dehydrogenase